MVLAEARERLLALHQRSALPISDLRERVRDVVILASSSRGGSSVVAEILRHSPDLLHFRAEVNLFFALAGYTFPESGTGSDQLGAEHLGDPAVLERLLACDVGNPTRDLPDDGAVERFARELHWRLSAQWPLAPIAEEQVQRWTRSVLDELRDVHGWLPGAFPDPQLFHTLLLRCARGVHPAINPWYYDIRPELIRAHHPGLEPSDAPPGPLLLEEPPFVTITPWRPVRESDLTRPLLIKTPSNVYRFGFLRALFPRARFRVFHLTRNAAASINGLYDGWRFRGFFAHHLPGRLSIGRYSDRHPTWGADWWKFDLPPDWESWVERPLIEVCGFQWRSAHRATLSFLADSDVDRIRLRFEDAVGPRDQRQRTFESLTNWLGVPLRGDLARLVETGLPPIMATSRPRLRRWFDKAELLDPVIHAPETLAILEQLGYALDPDTWT